MIHHQRLLFPITLNKANLTELKNKKKIMI